MEHASPEDYDTPGVSDGESVGEEHQSPESPSIAPNSATTKNGASVKNASHMQKRRRVTRACDECRRKKIKCDGKQPCTHCTVYSYECTYDQPSNRRRNPAPQYVENLEQRVHRAESLLHILFPNLDLNDPGIDAAVAQGWIPGAPGKGKPAHVLEQEKKKQLQPSQQPQIKGENKPDTKIESMVRAVAQIDMDEMGNWDYHGHSSGLSFVRRMREQLGDLMGPETYTTPFVKSRGNTTVLDSPKSTAESPMTGEVFPMGSDLPPKHIAQEICRCAVEDAAALLRAVHKPSFWQSFEHLYSRSPEQYTNEDQRFLPLFHSAMALGHLFVEENQRHINHDGFEGAIEQGFVHFRTARGLMDIADCRDLMSIQAVMMMILFLQSSAKLSQCYAYVGVALRSALRMGLHRRYQGNFDPVEAQTRKQVFWAVRKMDIYVAAMLGLPQTLSDDDIDQELPLEVDDDYVTKDGILPMPEGQLSVMAAFNAHTRLVQLLSKIVRCVYPIKVQDKDTQSYSVPFSTIREIESDLEEWKNSLPQILNPCPAPQRYTRVQYLLRLSYAHAQVMLYRPFLHYVAMEKRTKEIDQRAYACAASYIHVSRNIIHIQTQMKQKGLLNGAFWFTMYTSFFAILSLVYFAAENPDNSTTEAVMKDAWEGKEVLASVAKRSMAADRCTATLDVIFQRLPEWTRTAHHNPTVNKKRQHDSSQNTPQSLNPQASRSHPDVSMPNQNESIPGLQRRASTFPRHSAPQVLAGTSPASYDTWSQSGVSSIGPQTPTSTEFASGGYLNYNPLNTSNGMSQNMPQYSIPQSNFANPAIADLSTMIFPTADEPFGYPQQPLTTFENNQQFAKNNAYMSNQTYSAVENQNPLVARPTQGAADDNIEAQFFALPPFVDQNRQQPIRGLRYPGDTTAFSAAQAMGAPTTSAQMPNGWPGQQAIPQGSDMPDINIHNIFGNGTDWNHMLMNGFQPQ